MEPQPTRSDDPILPSSEPLTQPSKTAAPDGRRATPRTWMIALVASVVAGVVAWLAGENTYNRFQPSEEAASAAYSFEALNKEMMKVNALNGAVTFGIFGALLGASLALAGGLTRRSTSATIVWTLAGLVLGALGGALPSLAVMPWHWSHRNDDPSSLNLTLPLLIHAGLWCALGAAAGLSYGLGRVGPRPTALLAGFFGGLIGAAIGTVAYELIGAMGLPTDRTSDPFAGTARSRLLAFLSVSIFVAAFAVTFLHPRTRRKAKPAGHAPELG